MRVWTPVGAAALTLIAAVGVTAPAPAAIEVAPDYQVLAPIQSITSVDRNLLQQRVQRAWSQPALGERKSLAVDAFASGPEPELDLSGATGLMPASTTKLLTAAAVLGALGPEARFRTSVTRQRRVLHLVGGGDPRLTSAPGEAGVNANGSLARLARLTSEALAADGLTEIRLAYDDSLFAPPAEQPFWRKDFLPLGVVAPVTALMVDGGRLNPPASPRSPDPSRTAAVTFARLLQERGITVTGEPQPAVAQGAQIASVDSAPLADLVEHMLLVSDNTAAEVLAHHAGLELLGEPTFAGGARATLQVLAELGVPTDGIVLEDGSGLSRRNRISAEQLLAVIRAAIQTDPDALWPMYTGLPVAGFDGSLAGRFGAPSARAGRGAATGKTGTLTGTSTLAGLVVDRDGQLLTYAVMTNGVSTWSAAPAIDVVVARLAGCRCAGDVQAAPS